MTTLAAGSQGGASPASRETAGSHPASRGRLLDAAAVGLLLAAALIVHGSGILGGPVAYERDTALFYYPFTDWFAEQLRVGRLPHWIPTAFAGYPLLADGEVGPLYPLNLLVLPWLPTALAFSALRALHSALAGLFTYGLLRTLGVGRVGALTGGLIFPFSSFLVGQVQHENMIRSAVWLPGELWLLELALRRRGWARQRWLVACGVLVGLTCLGVHIQAVGMSLVALGLFALYRLLAGPVPGPWRERLLLLLWAPGLIGSLGVALAAAQWLPLFELGRTSFRGPGLRYDLATTYSLSPFNLPSLLFPYFFRGADGAWWSLWNPWETLPYVGIAPLALAALGLLARRRAVGYFALLSCFGLWVAMSHYAPLFNLHELLWRLPGFSSLRAPGRFSYLFVFGIAGLAAFGADLLARGRPGEPAARLVGRASGLLGLFALGLAAALPLLFTFLLQRLLANPGWGQQVADLRYLTLRRESPDLQPYQVYEGLLFSLNPANPKTALTLGLLVGLGGLLLARWRWPGRARLIAAALAGLTALDLLVFALDYHPRARLDDLMRLPPVGTALTRVSSGEHVFAEPVLSRLEPNRLTLGRVWDLSGYSSLQSQRHWEYVSSVDRVDNVLFDLWNGRFYVSPARRTDVAVVAGTAYRPYELLLSGGAGNPTGRERFRIPSFPSGELRVLSALTNAISVPQGTEVGEIILRGEDGRQVRFPLRAGLEVSEHAIDRPDVAPIMAHGRAQVIAGLPDAAPNGLPFTSNIYYAAFPINPPMAVQEIEVQALLTDGYLRLWGLGVVEPGTGRVRSLFADDKAKYEHPPLYQDDEAQIYRNAEAFPRAFVVPEALARRTRTEETAIARLALRPFDPRRQAVLEEGPFDDVPLAASQLPADGADARPLPPAAQVEDRGPGEVIVRASGPGVLVLTDAYHRGWRAYLSGADGAEREVPVYLANYVARAVGLPPGESTVRFVFDPLSWRLGIAVSLAAALFVLLVWSTALWWPGARRGR